MDNDLDENNDIGSKSPTTNDIAEVPKISTPSSNQCEKSSVKHEIITAWAMVIITFILMSLSFWQVKVMNDGLDETRKMNAETKALAEETIKFAKAQTEAARISAEYAKSAAIAAQGGTRIAELSFKTQARPYLGIEELKIESFDTKRTHSEPIGSRLVT